jgi:hypothetical protein
MTGQFVNLPPKSLGESYASTEIPQALGFNPERLEDRADFAGRQPGIIAPEFERPINMIRNTANQYFANPSTVRQLLVADAEQRANSECWTLPAATMLPEDAMS